MLSQSRERLAHAERLRDKQPTTYAREYQIPDEPRLNLLNECEDQPSPLVIHSQTLERYACPVVNIYPGELLSSLFVDNGPGKDGASAAGPRSIIRKTLTTENDVQLSGLWPSHTLECLRGLIQLLGWETDDEEEFAAQALKLVQQQGDTSVQKAEQSFRIVKKIIDVFHQTHVLNQDGVSQTVYPTWCKKDSQSALINSNQMESDEHIRDPARISTLALECSTKDIQRKSTDINQSCDQAECQFAKRVKER